MPSKIKTINEIDNPYEPYNLNPDIWFYDKETIRKVREILQSSYEKIVVIIHGNPGSGKTRILKRLSNSREILGDKYIPIYLDSGGYKDLSLNDVYLFIYRDIIESLRKIEFHGIDEPDYSTKQIFVKSKTRSFKQIFDYILEAGMRLILILDEFDVFMESMGPREIAAIIRFFRIIQEGWSNYGLILAGDKNLVDLAETPYVKDFLSSAIPINIRDTLEDEQIKRMIIDPVKDELLYDYRAIEKIIWLTGGNLYFQQLVCFHILQYLNSGYGNVHNVCFPDDVDEAKNRILNDESSGFEFRWKKNLSLEGRLIASALADESVTKERGEFYFLEKYVYLDEIFGDQIFEEIEKLHEFGIIKKIEERRFEGFPFKIPLYGMWIRKHHPFIRTLIENIDSIADKVSLTTLINEIEKLPPSVLVSFNREAFLRITKKWCFLKESFMLERYVDKRSHTRDILLSISKLLELNIRDVKDKDFSNFNYFIISLKRLNIGNLDEAFCFIQDRPLLIDDDINYIENIATAFAQDDQTKLIFFFCFKKIAMLEELDKKPFLNLITINENDLKKISLSERPTKVFTKIILSRLSLEKVSPYKTSGPARSTFYGRSSVINQIIGSRNRSFSIVGARKIGKSSLLHKLNDQPPPNTYYIFMDLDLEFSPSDCSYETFLRSLELEIKDVFGKIVDFSGKLSNLPVIIKDLSDEKNIIFILDELDALIDFDRRNNYKLLKAFRAMANKNYCQFIFAGFKELYHGSRNHDSPLYNFCEEILLTPLERGAADYLITLPMNSIGVHYTNEEDKELIFEYTANHPNLLQFICKHLIEKVERHPNIEDKRLIFRRDIVELFNLVYEEYIVDRIYMFFSDLADIDKLIIIKLVEEHTNAKVFSMGRIRDILNDIGVRISINDVHKNLRNLVMRFILIDKGRDRYAFALSIFPEILKRRIDQNLENSLIKEVIQNA